MKFPEIPTIWNNTSHVPVTSNQILCVEVFSQKEKCFLTLPNDLPRRFRRPLSPFLSSPSLSQGELQRGAGVLHLHFDQVTLLGTTKETKERVAQRPGHGPMEWEFGGIPCKDCILRNIHVWGGICIYTYITYIYIYIYMSLCVCMCNEECDMRIYVHIYIYINRTYE